MLSSCRCRCYRRAAAVVVVAVSCVQIQLTVGSNFVQFCLRHISSFPAENKGSLGQDTHVRIGANVKYEGANVGKMKVQISNEVSLCFVCPLIMYVGVKWIGRIMPFVRCGVNM